MTYNELKERVAHLGFERTVDEDALLYSAAERALATIFIDRGEKGRASIYVQTPESYRVYGRVRHRSGEAEEIEVVGDAFSFRPYGRGSCLVISQATATRVEFDGTEGVVKGHIPSSAARIRFEGESDYTVVSLAAFAGKFDLSLTGVPLYSERRVIDLLEHIGDIRTLAAPPRLPSGEIAPDVTPQGRRIELPFRFDGELIIDYYRLPRVISRTEGEIDLAPDTAHLLPLLTAAYVWLDDDAEKSQYYMALYQSGMAAALRAARLDDVKGYKTNGWA